MELSYAKLGVLVNQHVSGTMLFSDNPTCLESEEFHCPCVVLSSEDEPLLIIYAENDKKPLASIKFQQAIIGTSPSPKVAKCSSRGHSYRHEYILKPDVIAPGSFILGSMNPKAASYNDNTIMSGTPMACPHVTGTASTFESQVSKMEPCCY